MQKKKYKMAFVAAILGAACIFMNGCGDRLTAKEVMYNMEQAQQEKEPTHARLIMKLVMNSQPYMDYDIKFQVSENPTDLYAEGQYVQYYGTQSFSEDMEIYTKLNGSTLSTYTHLVTSDIWTYKTQKYETPAEPEEETTEAAENVGEKLLQYLALDQFMDIKLDWNTVLVDLQEAYVLRVDFNFEDALKFLKKHAHDIVDLSALAEEAHEDTTVSAVYYLDTDTFLPLRTEMSIDQLGGTPSNSNDVYSIQMIFNVLSYEPQEIPQVPDDIKEKYTNVKPAKEETNETEETTT